MDKSIGAAQDEFHAKAAAAGLQQAIDPCFTDGCTAKVRVRGLCFRHGVKTTCIQNGCSTNAKNKGYCWKHLPGRKICSAAGCTNGAKARALCNTHGTKRICGLPQCDNLAQRGLLCVRHRAYDVCTFGDCANRSTRVGSQEARCKWDLHCCRMHLQRRKTWTLFQARLSGQVHGKP